MWNLSNPAYQPINALLDKAPLYSLAHFPFQASWFCGSAIYDKFEGINLAGWVDDVVKYSKLVPWDHNALSAIWNSLCCLYYQTVGKAGKCLTQHKQHMEELEPCVSFFKNTPTLITGNQWEMGHLMPISLNWRQRLLRVLTVYFKSGTFSWTFYILSKDLGHMGVIF